MSVEMLTRWLMWCTIVDAGLLACSALILVCAGGWVYRVQSKWFPMPRETFNVVIYCFIGIFKIIFIVFNVVPWVALLIAGHR